jgi:hypothetical protein
MSQPPRDYLTRMCQLGIDPNFWCSDCYFLHARFVEYQKDGLIWVRDRLHQLIFPPLPVGSPERCLNWDVSESVWCGWEGYSPASGVRETLDIEYFYRAERLAVLSEAPATFRKHVKRFIRDMGKHPVFTPWRHYPCISESDLIQVVLANLDASEQEELEDGDAVISFITESPSVLVLMPEGSREVWGVVGYDRNWKYLNFRYCFTRSDIHPYLQEYVRWRFYGMAFANDPETIVNDGGTLGRPGLKNFKDRLRPNNRREVYSWEPERKRK